MRDMREIGLLRADPLSHGDRFLQAEVRGVRTVAQAVENQNVEPFESRPTGIRNRVGVGAIGDVTEAKTEHFEPRAVLKANRHDAASQHLKRLRMMDAVKLQARDGPHVRGGAAVERVVEAGA